MRYAPLPCFQWRINGAWHPSIKKFVGGGGFETVWPLHSLAKIIKI
jgi:hypothetical protein